MCPQGPSAHLGPRAFWLGGVWSAGQLSEDGRGIGSVGDVVGDGGAQCNVPIFASGVKVSVWGQVGPAPGLRLHVGRGMPVPYMQRRFRVLCMLVAF